MKVFGYRGVWLSRYSVIEVLLYQTRVYKNCIYYFIGQVLKNIELIIIKSRQKLCIIVGEFGLSAEFTKLRITLI